MENLLLDPMYDTPNSSIKHVLVDSDSVLFKRSPLYFTHEQVSEMEKALEQENKVYATFLASKNGKKEHDIAFS
ncbi:ATP-binding protein [Basidiobolus ranarum]|uniref:ATP-binding protein n=1 Tax=Basidiobolus ranarum TaxID=34480 RepID=A0ABR2WHA9_9FUNG